MMLRLTTSALVRQSLAMRAGGARQLTVRAFSAAAAVPKFDKESVRREMMKEATGKMDNKHHSNAEDLIERVGVIKVKGSVAVCDGGGGSLGHPIEYIQLELKTDEPAVCKYCGLKFEKDHDHHGHH